MYDDEIKDWFAGYGLICLYLVAPGVILGTAIHLLRHAL